MTTSNDDVRERVCWCGSSAWRRVASLPLGHGQDAALLRCEGCGVFRLHPPPTAELLHAAYDRAYYGATRRKFVGPLAALANLTHRGAVRLVTRTIPPGARVLDIGCGNGDFLLRLKRRGYLVEGTELSARSAARVPAQHNIPVHVGDLLTLDLPPESYNAVTLWHVLEHLPDPHAACAAIHRLLKPDGWLFLAMPNIQSWQARLFGRHWFHHDPPRHLFGFGPRSLNVLLRNTGFEPVTIGSGSGIDLQGIYGYAQSTLNALGLERDGAYQTLKGTSRRGLVWRAVDILLLALLTTPALFASAAESLRGRGGVVNVTARKRQNR